MTELTCGDCGYQEKNIVFGGKDGYSELGSLYKYLPFTYIPICGQINGEDWAWHAPDDEPACEWIMHG